MYPLKNNTSRNKIARNIIVIMCCVFAAQVLIRLWQIYLLNSFADGNVAGWVLSLSDSVYYFSVAVWYITHIILGITYIQWSRRAYYNIHVIDNNLPYYGEGWAAGAWFVPFMNLVRPYSIMREIWTNSLFLLSREINQSTFPKKLVNSWWILWIVYLVMGGIANTYARHSDTGFSQFIVFAILNIICYLLGITGLLILNRIIKKFDPVETDLYTQYTTPNVGDTVQQEYSPAL